MNKVNRARTLARMASPLGAPGKLPPRLVPAESLESLGWDEIGFVVEGLVYGPRPVLAATRDITRRHDLGPRGAFILSLIDGGVDYPLELATVFKIGRSLITAELIKLTEAGLIAAKQGEADKRRTRLTLTPEGNAACHEVRDAMDAILRRNLAAYSADEIRLLGRMLRDARRIDGDDD